MKEHPILFSDSMVRAIMDGTKTQTRRVIKFPPLTYQPNIDWVKAVCQDGGGNWVAWSTDAPGVEDFTKKAYPNGEGFPCPYGQPGHRLWVKETWTALFNNDDEMTLWWHDTPKEQRTKDRLANGITYWADYKPELNDEWPFVPSIFMPRWASRLTLEVTNIGVERVKDISEEDAIAEGVQPINSPAIGLLYKPAFCSLWNEINGKRPGCSWQDNPWVWVVSFKRKD